VIDSRGVNETAPAVRVFSQSPTMPRSGLRNTNLPSADLAARISVWVCVLWIGHFVSLCEGRYMLKEYPGTRRQNSASESAVVESLNAGITSVTASSQKPIRVKLLMLSRWAVSALRAADSGGHQAL
jgi:hypothetical protein